MKLKQYFSLLFILLSALFPLASEDFLYTQISASAESADVFETSAEIAQWSSVHGGFFTFRSNEKVVLRLPEEELAQFKDFLESITLYVSDYSVDTADLRDSLNRAYSALAAKEEILEKDIEYLEKSDFHGTLILEREIRNLMLETDKYKGILNKLNFDRKNAAITVFLNSPQKDLPDYRPSVFSWINNVDFFMFFSDYPEKDGNVFSSALSLELPDNFAVVKSSGCLYAFTPEGARLRLKKIKNSPRKDTGFWIEALENNLKSRGYIPLKSPAGNLSEEISKLKDGENFKYLYWVVNTENRRYFYTTALRVKGSNIELLEFAEKIEK